MSRPKPRVLPKAPREPDMVAVHILSSDASQDRLIARQEARKRYLAGELSFDVTNGAYCLRLEDFNPNTDSTPRIPEFLLTAPRRGQ